MPQQPGLFHTVRKSFRGVEKCQGTIFFISEIKAWGSGQPVKQFKAGETELTQNGNAALHVTPIAGAAKLPQPGEQIRLKTGLDVKRAGRVEHPLEPLGYNPGGRQRYAVAGNNKTGIAVGTAGADVVFFNHRNLSAQFIKIMAAADADGAAANYKCLGLMVHNSILLASRRN